MKTRTKTLIAIGVATALIAATGFAAYSHGHGKHASVKAHLALFATGIFDTIDANGDGMLSQTEIDQIRNERHATHDANGDDSLDLEEFAGLWQETMRPLTVRAFQILDADGDAIVSRSEYDRPFNGLVQRLDRNGDGGLSMGDRWRGHHGKYRKHDG